ncbi:dihydrolipoyl dehydrogenase family protein [Nodularia spumigena]|uniref:dihydrolipoyl dehydrogenase family protein n=1 Tax=Nodularia spumigena TaxID=70799 RepID=UPI00232C82DF|nr:NAD(P)/FAD-dependent oxidoreductase [Nodularia spumigena]MDB9358599.1 NAD(P)/FAD-dependent oxidoreductase [Nodularia spumigena CS-587/03]MDB9319519.1 NAD(P)/FAD-dependent oxidoreductase [Nodularia spumigena CS-590/01A]MDB9322267.1 NAD(P)/FAD-dependent oxidoreductase [Nodularia spumigena CS-591/07A]MDB9331370.1 NAD(P)/FAD-dependent oxidoreductase [Nodularia spumigena CS-591/04]MDB9336323.1 NAD(P)/FAD-dependent oxidoreductase [Nodularia spumigena CS-590/01]
MTIDYDLVIIGGTLAGRYAALVATQLKATVALVESQVNYEFSQHQAMSEIGNIVHNMNDVAGLGIHTTQAKNSDKCQASVTWPEAKRYTDGVVSNIQEQNSPANLAALGVDVILGSGQFQSLPHLAFAVNQRLLRGRTYLLASGSVRGVPDIEGLHTTSYLTLSNIWQSLKQPTLPKNWVIIGGVPQSIEVAQTLARLGCSVTLAVKSASILPYADPEIAHLLQAQLEVDGVRVLTQKPVTQVKLIEDKKWVQAGDKAIETDEILVATEQEPNVEFLNLAAVGVKWRQRRLVVNDKLQTTNHRIYACGDVIGGYDFPNVANYEARIAVKNALFFPRLRVNYQCVPWGLNSHPRLAEVGLTEAQAKRQFKLDEVFVLRQYYKSVTAAQLRDETTGICKLIVLRNGEILGASILGAEAGELINLIALAMSQKISIKQLANLSAVYPSFSEIIENAAREWGKEKLNSNFGLQDFLEGLFHFRRDWNL